ncbi:MAG TPA: hypothetical protein VGM73_06465 [Candidatus Didemnitutus sp.]|jgi:uncharacterized membrane protein
MDATPPPAPPPAAPPPVPTAPAGEDKTVAIIAYLTIIGFIIALVMFSSKKTALGGFHLRQTLGFVVTGFAVGVICVIPILGWLIAILAMPCFFVLWILGLIAAVNGQMKPVPVVGPLYQKWFANAFV